MTLLSTNGHTADAPVQIFFFITSSLYSNIFSYLSVIKYQLPHSKTICTDMFVIIENNNLILHRQTHTGTQMFTWHDISIINNSLTS